MTLENEQPVGTSLGSVEDNLSQPGPEPSVREGKKELRDLFADVGEHTEELILNMGPQHPATHGVLRIVLRLNGETIEEAVPDIGYLHRGIEKLAEKWTYPMVLPVIDRMDYLSVATNEFVYAMAVEKLLGVEVPARGQYIRVIMSELSRIASHLIFFATFTLDMGAITPFLYGLREREYIMNLFEMVAGARLTLSYFRVGGVREDVPDGFKEKCLEYCDIQEKMLKEYDQLFTGNRIAVHRMRDLSILPPDVGLGYGASGPTLRASGVAYDVRKSEPYSGYENFDFNVATRTEGDSYARYLVRLDEIGESLKIIRQAVNNLPDGPYMAKVPRVIKPPAGEAVVHIEAPRGDTGVYLVSDGSTNPYRMKWRAPTFNHVSMLPYMLKGYKIADSVIIGGSIDVVLGEVDR